MARLLTTALALMTLVPALPAQDKDKPKPDTPGVAEQIKALQAEIQKQQQELIKSYRAAKTDDDKAKIELEFRKLAPKHAGKFLELAQKNAKDPAAVDALLWVVQNAGHMSEAETAVGMLLKNHMKDAKVAAAARGLAGIPFAPTEKLLRGLVEQSTGDAKGSASYFLAQHLKSKAEAVNMLKGGGEVVQRFERFFGEAVVKQVASNDPAKLLAEAEKLLETIAEKYPDAQHPFGGKLGENVKRELFELRHLSIGRVAPDIEGEDIDGKKFKLSDYRGKVVVLDFWGHW